MSINTPSTVKTQLTVFLKNYCNSELILNKTPYSTGFNTELNNNKAICKIILIFLPTIGGVIIPPGGYVSFKYINPLININSNIVCFFDSYLYPSDMITYSLSLSAQKNGSVYITINNISNVTEHNDSELYLMVVIS